MKTAVSLFPVFAVWRVMGRPLPYIQISRWSLSLRNDPVFKKFLHHVSCPGCKVRRLFGWNQQPFSWSRGKAQTACNGSMYFGGRAVRYTLMCAVMGVVWNALSCTLFCSQMRNLRTSGLYPFLWCCAKCSEAFRLILRRYEHSGYSYWHM
jgi:hypothetical protein